MVISAAAILLVLLGPPTAEFARPPKLTFNKSVKYVKWYNDWVSKGKRDNAAPYYERILPPPKGVENDKVERTLLAVLSDDEKRQLPKAGIRWVKDDAPLLAVYLEKNRTALGLFVEATTHKDYFEHFDDRKLCLFETEYRLFKISRSGCQALLAESLLGPEAGADALLRALPTVFHAASHSQQTNTVIGSLICIAIQAGAYDHIRGAMDSGLLSAGDAIKAFKLIRTEDPGPADWRTPFTAEWGSSLDMLQLACPDGKSTREGWKTFYERTVPGEPVDEKVLSIVVNVIPTRLLSFIEDYHKTLIRVAEHSLRQKYVNRIQLSRDRAIPENIVDFANSLFFPDLSRGYELAVRVESSRRATMLVLALHIHHDKHGDWPKTLKDIDPKLGLEGLKTYRIDTFSGKQFKYELRDGKPFLYSVGIDGKDDGGQHHPKWGEGGAGGDYVYWPYQRE